MLGAICNRWKIVAWTQGLSLIVRILYHWATEPPGHITNNSPPEIYPGYNNISSIEKSGNTRKRVHNISSIGKSRNTRKTYITYFQSGDRKTPENAYITYLQSGNRKTPEKAYVTLDMCTQIRSYKECDSRCSFDIKVYKTCVNVIKLVNSSLTNFATLDS